MTTTTSKTKRKRSKLYKTHKYTQLTPFQKYNIIVNILRAINLSIGLALIAYSYKAGFRSKVNNYIIDNLIRQGYLKVI